MCTISEGYNQKTVESFFTLFSHFIQTRFAHSRFRSDGRMSAESEIRMRTGTSRAGPSEIGSIDQRQRYWNKVSPMLFFTYMCIGRGEGEVLLLPTV